MSIYVTRPSLPDFDDYINEIRPIFENRQITNMGPVYKKFQKQLIDYLGVEELSLFVNGHMALEMAINAMGLCHEGGEVITTPFTFVSTTHAIVRNGLKPVFCDIDPVDYTLDSRKLESLINENTVAIVPVHVYGNVCDVEGIEAVAKKHGLKVIYDAAHAFGVKYKGKGIGTFGDASMFSFHATKVFNSIEGGAVSFHDSRYCDPLHDLKNFGIHGLDDVTGIGANAKLDEFRAAMGVCNLRRMDECISARKRIDERYNRHLEGVEGLTVRKPQKDVETNYAYYPVYFDKEKFGKSRDEVYDALAAQDVFARKYYYPAINELSCYKGMFPLNTPVAHNVSENILTLPMYEGLSDEDVDRICSIVLEK